MVSVLFPFLMSQHILNTLLRSFRDVAFAGCTFSRYNSLELFQTFLKEGKKKKENSQITFF